MKLASNSNSAFLLRNASLLLLLLSSIFAPKHTEAYTLRDGDALPPERAAFFVAGGYPESRLGVIGAPRDYIDLGFQLSFGYTPDFELDLLTRFQLAETKDEAFNFALTFNPGIIFSLFSDKLMVTLPIESGFAMGWHFVRGASFYWRGAYAVVAPLSPTASFAHYPTTALGFEIGTGAPVNLFFEGLVRFKAYDPDQFIYGGLGGIGVALW